MKDRLIGAFLGLGLFYLCYLIAIYRPLSHFVLGGPG